MKFRTNSWTLRANVEVSSLETVRSPALMWLSKPGVAPLSRAYPRLMNAVPSGLSRRFATKLSLLKRCQEPFLDFWQHFRTLLMSFGSSSTTEDFVAQRSKDSQPQSWHPSRPTVSALRFETSNEQRRLNL